MPELPEVEIHRRNLTRWSRGRRIAGVRVVDRRAVAPSSPRRFVQRLRGRRVERVERKGKWLLLVLDDGQALASHLGMTGKWLRDEGTAKPEPPVRVAIELEDGGRLLFRDPRLFGRLRVGPADELRAEVFDPLGPDPLERGWGAARLAERLGKTTRPIKVVLMDQAVVAGLGNIQAAESLWGAKLDPRRPAGSLTGAERSALARAIRSSIRRTIEAQSAGDPTYVEEAGAPNPFRIYGRAGEPCPRCGTPIRRMIQAGRSTYFCPRCQRVR